METDKSSDFLLPQGNQLISILTSYNIKDADLYMLLKNKGIYTGCKERKHMIMILASTLITSDDFQFLAQRVADRDDKYRTTEASISCSMDESEKIVHFIGEEYIKKLLDNASDNYPTFVIKNSDYQYVNENKVSINGQVETHDWIRSLQSSQRVHDFALDIEQRDGRIYFTSGTTTIETKRLIQYLRNEINISLRKEGVVNKKSKLFILKNDSFYKNEYMFEFFRKFSEKGYFGLKFKKIQDIIFNINENSNLPKEFGWMKERIEEISLRGEDIQANDIIKLGDDGCLNFGEIESEFSFKFGDYQGLCTIKYGFPSGHKKTKRGNNKSVEFETKVLNIDCDNKNFEIKKLITNDFNSRKAIICNEMFIMKKLDIEANNQKDFLKDV